MALKLDLKLKGEDKVRNALKAFERKSGVPIKFVLADQTRLWAQDLMGSAVKIPPNRKAGRKMVSKDLAKLFVGLVSGDKSVVNTEDPSLVNIHAASGAIWTTDTPLMDRGASESKLAARHKAKRNRRTGRVRIGRVVQKRGNLTYLNKLHVKRSSYRRYRRRIQQHVGKMKAGWIEAVEQLASAANTTARFPAWLRKAPRTGGRANISMFRGSGYVSATNRVPYAAKKYEAFMPKLRLKRLKDITGAMWKRMDRVVEQFNRGRM